MTDTENKNEQTVAKSGKLTLKLKPLSATASTPKEDTPTVGRKKVIDLSASETPRPSTQSRMFNRNLRDNVNNRPIFERKAPPAANPREKMYEDKPKQTKLKQKKSPRTSNKPILDKHNSQLRFDTGTVRDFADSDDLSISMPEGRRKNSRRKFTAKPVVAKEIEIFDGMELKYLAKTTSMTLGTVLHHLKQLTGERYTKDIIDIDTAQMLVMELGHTPKVVKVYDPYQDPVEDYDGEMVTRPPIVTIVGHVDHGKTSLLDKIRHSSVVDKEAGGITQHVGAYQVKDSQGRVITFLDTPGHETFTSMRARGVNLTDIVLLVVAADSGVQAQTVESIKHIQAAGTPLIVVFTKIDKPNTNIQQIKNILLSYGVITQDFGGDALTAEVSAHTGKGIIELLDTINMQAELLELKNRNTGHAVGLVLETKIVKGMGNTVNMIVQKGCMKAGDFFVVGDAYGKVKTITSDAGEQIKQAASSQPVTITGLDGLCKPGDKLIVVPSEKIAKEVSQARIDHSKKNQFNSEKKTSLMDLLNKVEEEKMLKVILKADTAGSLEALEAGLKNVDQTHAKIEVVMGMTGPVVESDIMLAQTTGAMIISFHIAVPKSMDKICQEKGIKVLQHNIIYKLFETVEEMISGMKEIVETEVDIATSQVIKVFEFSKGNIAGCKILNGTVKRGMKVKIMRNGEEIARDTLRTMQKDMQSINEAGKGFEVGIVMNDFDAFKVNDELVFFEIQES